LETIPSLILGTIIGGTSSAVVVPMVKGLNMKEPASTILILESAITDVLCIVLVAALIDVYQRGGGFSGQIAGSILSSLFFAIIIGLVGGLGWLFIISKVDRFRRSMFSTVAAVFIGFGIAEQLGFSGAITALSFGFTLTNFKSFRFNRLPILKNVIFAVINESEKNFYREIVFLLKTFFFLFLGLSIKFESILSFAAALALVVIIYVTRLVLCRLTVSRKIPQKEISVMSIMVPKGLAAAVLAGMPMQANVTGGEIIQNVVFAVVLISIVVTAVMVPLIDKTDLRLMYQKFFSGFAKDVTAVVATVPVNEPITESVPGKEKDTLTSI
jgi:NhaP-type Na+/H+ or K+/H+ antiporter